MEGICNTHWFKGEGERRVQPSTELARNRAGTADMPRIVVALLPEV